MCATLCSLNRRILFSVFYVLPSGVINDDDDNTDSVISTVTTRKLIWTDSEIEQVIRQPDRHAGHDVDIMVCC